MLLREKRFAAQQDRLKIDKRELCRVARGLSDALLRKKTITKEKKQKQL